MLIFPDKGFPSCREEHRLDLEILCDLVEASAIFGQDPISQPDLVDRLLEEEIYSDYDLAFEIVDRVWLTLGERKSLCPKTYPLSVESMTVQIAQSEDRFTAYRFCLVLSLATCYGWWHKTFGGDYSQQGNLFEQLAEEVFPDIFGGWKPRRVGRGNSSHSDQKTLQELVEIVAECTRCTAPVIEEHGFAPNSRSGDLGLDLIWYRPFRDSREGIPYFLVQCASGGNWRSKLQEPNLKRWRKILNPTVDPLRSVVVPFWLSDSDLKLAAIDAGGLVLDRCRLLSENTDISYELKGDLERWCEPRIAELLRRSNGDR